MRVSDWRERPWRVRIALGFVLCAAACGARTSLESGVLASDPSQPDDAGPPATCATDGDCGADLCVPMECREGSCVALPHVLCDDRDECTEDSCEAATGLCRYLPLSFDLDGDGHKSPRPGYAPGAPGSCGDDCDDTSAKAFPGGVELCDGVDNDCDGVIDNGAAYSGGGGAVRVSSTAFDRASGAGLAFDGSAYGASYTGHQGKSHPYFQGLSASGAVLVPEIETSAVNSEVYAGGLVYNGQYFGTSWQDARQDGEYEIYFKQLDSQGKPLGPDLRVTNSPGKSLNPMLAWNGAEFLDVWDDRRFDDGSSNDVRIFGQRIALDGSLVGGNVQLSAAGGTAEYPAIAVGTSKVGIVFAATVGSDVQASFFTTDPDFSNPSSPVELGTTQVHAPHIAYAQGRFVVVWDRYDKAPGSAIYGAAVDEQGNVLVSERAVTQSSPFAADPSLLSLGDRLMLAWAGYTGGHYQLFQGVLGLDLGSVSNAAQLPSSPADSRSPVLSFGPSGDIGVLFDDWRSGARQSYFARMSCAMGPPCCKP